jgi:hypothetical protein
MLGAAVLPPVGAVRFARSRSRSRDDRRGLAVFGILGDSLPYGEAGRWFVAAGSGGEALGRRDALEEVWEVGTGDAERA